MRFQWKVLALVLGVVVATATAVIWKTQNMVVEDKMGFVADSAMKQVAPLKRLIDEKLADAQKELVRFAASRAVNGPGRETDFGPFDVIALIEANGGAPAPTWTERGSTAKAESWPYGHDLTLLKSLPYSKVRDGQRYWVRVADGKGSAVFALVVPVEVKPSEQPAAPTATNLPDDVRNAAPKSRTRAYIVGFSTENPLASITEDFIGSISNVYVVDDRGYVASHVDKAYNGALFTEDPIVGEIVKARMAMGNGRYEDLESRPVIGHFEKVENSNLTAIISIPIRAVTASADAQLQTAILTALAMTIVAALIAWFVGGVMTPPQRAPVFDLGSAGLPASYGQGEPEHPQVPPLQPPPPSKVPPLAVHPVKNEASLQNERKLAYEAFQQGLGQQMRDPVLSILGHAQLIRANVGDEASVREHVESIEREARNAKESLDRLTLFEQVDLPLEEDATFDLTDVVARTLEAKDVDLQAAGVVVERDLATMPRLHGRASDFSVALAHMIDNSIEAMRDRPVRRLKVKTENHGDVAALSISDSGIGMSRDVKNRVFEPFFKNFQSPFRMGLGLSYVHAVARRVDAKAEIDSTPGEGTIVTLKFPLDAGRARGAAIEAVASNEVEEFKVMKP
ncbi:MAG: ATP-binding protein, partial [Bdellovibrionota bacterium]